MTECCVLVLCCVVLCCVVLLSLCCVVVSLCRCVVLCRVVLCVKKTAALFCVGYPLDKKNVKTMIFFVVLCKFQPPEFGTPNLTKKK